MDQAYKKASAFIFAAIVTTSTYGMDNENVVEVSTEQVVPVMWYKKGSVQAAAAVTVAVVGCAFAVRMGKVAVPGCITALYAAKLVQESAPKSDFVDNSSEQQFVEQNQDQVVKHVVEVSKSEMPVDWSKGMLNFFENAIKNLTEEDLKQIHEECNR